GSRRNSAWACLCAWILMWVSLAGRAVRIAGVLALAAVCMAGPAHAQDEFLDPAEAFVLSAAMANPTELHVHFRIAPDYYMYRERFGLEADAPIAGEPIFPRGTVKYDPTFDEDLEVYHDRVTIRLPLQAGAGQAVPLRITGQG